MSTGSHVVLFNSPRINEKRDVLEMEGVYPRIGIASIAAFLKQRGIRVSILDPQIESSSRLGRIDYIHRKVKELQPDIVGIPAFTEEIYESALVAKIVKEVDPHPLIVVGGPHPSAMQDQVLQEFQWFDVAVVGEGELTMAEIADGASLDRVAGIAYRQNTKIKMNPARAPIVSLDNLPKPAWELYNLNAYRGASLSSGFKKKTNILELPIEGARGCPFACNFCFRITGPNLRVISPERIVDEMERDIDEFHADTLFFVEGTFGANKKHGLAVCNEIIKRGLNEKITWSTGARVDTVDEELLTIMKKAGCSFIGFGVESGDPKILKSVGKYIHPEQSIAAFRLSKKLGIRTEANFILGHPGETYQSVMKTIKLAKKLEADEANFAILVPFPGTPIYEMASAEIGDIRIKTRDWRLYGKQLGEALDHKTLSSKTLAHLQAKAYREFYLRWSRFPNLLKKITIKRIIRELRRMV